MRFQKEPKVYYDIKKRENFELTVFLSIIHYSIDFLALPTWLLINLSQPLCPMPPWNQDPKLTTESILCHRSSKHGHVNPIMIETSKPYPMTSVNISLSFNLRETDWCVYERYKDGKRCTWYGSHNNENGWSMDMGHREHEDNPSG